MGKRGVKKSVNKNKAKVPIAYRARKMQANGKLKRKKGDLKMISARNTSYEVKQKKGGKWIRTGERKCNIHTVCDCVRRTDPGQMKYVNNR